MVKMPTRRSFSRTGSPSTLSARSVSTASAARSSASTVTTCRVSRQHQFDRSLGGGSRAFKHAHSGHRPDGTCRVAEEVSRKGRQLGRSHRGDAARRCRCHRCWPAQDKERPRRDGRTGRTGDRSRRAPASRDDTSPGGCRRAVLECRAFLAIYAAACPGLSCWSSTRSGSLPGSIRHGCGVPMAKRGDEN